MKILLLDKNHPLIIDQLTEKGFSFSEDYTSSYDEILKNINNYEGIIIRSRIPIDENFLRKSTNLKFVARVGAGLENIDTKVAQELGIKIISSPEGNRDAVAEHVVGMLLLIMHRLKIASNEVQNGVWLREENRGDELFGKTFGIIGYGNMGKAVAKRLSGFGLRVIFYDILPNLSDEYAKQVSLEELQKESDILSLHIPLTDETFYMIDDDFISQMQKPFYLINTARGKNVNTKSLVKAMKSNLIKGVCLDVLEYEKSSFEKLENVNSDLEYLLNTDKAIITPHIAGWTTQSKSKLAQVIVDKIIYNFA